MEPGDGEMTVPPVLTPVTEIFSPIENLLTVPLLSQDTWLLNSVLQGAGVSAAQSANFPTFASGRWDLDLTMTIQFSGTSNINSQAQLGLNDPLVSTQNIFNAAMIAGGAGGLVFHQTLRMLFLVDGWRFVHSTPALVLGDVMFTAVTVYARRVF